LRLNEVARGHHRMYKIGDSALAEHDGFSILVSTTLGDILTVPVLTTFIYLLSHTVILAPTHGQVALLTTMAHASPAFSDWTSSSSTPMMTEKHSYHQNAAYIPLRDQTPHNSSFPHEHPSQHLLGSNTANASLARIERLKHYNAIIAIILNLFSVGITLTMEAIMVYVLYKFYTTKDIPSPGRTSPWANNTQLWPAFVLLAGSLVTFLLDLGSLIAMCCRKSRRAQKLEEGLGYVGHIFYVVKWIVVATLYLVGKTSRDLWGWSCDVRAAKIQEFYVTDLNFERLCMEQVSRVCCLLFVGFEC